MRVAGVREVKAKLSEYLRMVREGETILVTDHDEVIAQLSPPALYVAHRHASELDALQRLADTGELRLAKGMSESANAAPLPAPTGVDVRALIDDVRGE